MAVFPRQVSSATRITTRRFVDISKRNLLPLLVLGVLASQVLVIAQSVLLTVWVAKLARRPMPTLVETRSGIPLTVEAKDPLSREPRTIEQFVSTSLVRLWSWSSTLPQSDGKVTLDKGTTVGEGRGGRWLPTPTYQAGYALSESFRAPFLQRLSSLVPRNVRTGGSRTLLIPTRVGEPEEIEPGRWKLDFIANLITFAGNDRIGAAVPFNKVVYVEAAYPPPPDAVDSDEARAAAKTRAAGLQIYRIVDLHRS